MFYGFDLMGFITIKQPAFLGEYDTLPKFNMEPQNDGFQKESPIPGTSFQVPC